MQVLDPNIKRLKSIIRNLKFRKNRNEFKLKRKMPSVCFGGKKNLKNGYLDIYRYDASIFIGQVKHLEFDLIRNQSH